MRPTKSFNRPANLLESNRHVLDGTFLSAFPAFSTVSPLFGLAHRERMVFIGRPYGVEHGLGQYGTVLMFATSSCTCQSRILTFELRAQT
jgi:hypothetical protein